MRFFDAVEMRLGAYKKGVIDDGGGGVDFIEELVGGDGKGGRGGFVLVVCFCCFMHPGQGALWG